MPADDRVVRDQLIELLRGGGAHIDFHSALKDYPESIYGAKPEKAPYSAWQLLEHVRFTLRDLFEFSTNPEYVAPNWPADYWVKEDGPASAAVWETSVKAVSEDLIAFEKLVGDPGSNLYAKIPWGDGQNLFREVLLAADHTSYHLGQIVLLKKQLTA